LIQISTDEVFGSVDEGSFSEESPFRPNSPYSASKAGGDLMCRAYFETFRTPVIVTHSCNFYGPNQYPEKLIPLFITNLLENKKVPLYGDGLNVREWIFTSDHCEAIDQILHKGKVGEIYNIGTGEEKTNKEVTQVILDSIDKDWSCVEAVKDRPGHDRRYSVDARKLKKELHWEPRVGFEAGIKKTIAWYEENEWWWKPLKSGEYEDYYRKQYIER
jgi:dTDP-glucose 4,6-dehydratase